MPDFGSFRGFGEKLVQGQTPTQLGKIGSESAFDGDANAFFLRVANAGGTLSNTEKIAVNQLVLDLKANSLWTGMQAIYPMVGASAEACSQNLKSSSFTGTFMGGWTFTSNGVNGNGTTGYVDLGIKPNQMTQNSIHMSTYIRNIFVENGIYIGSLDGTSSCYISNGDFHGLNSTDVPAYGAVNGLTGLITSTRIASNQFKLFRNNSLRATISTASVAPNANNLYIAARNNSGTAAFYSRSQNAFSSIGQGLTDTESSNLYTVVQAFQTSLSRNV
jgi:hypothetical protein